MAYEIIAELTDEARIAWAQQLVNGIPSVQIVEFAVGEGGYDPSDPRTALPPDPTQTSLESEIFRDTYDSIEWYNSFCPIFVCKLEQGEAVGSIGELGLFALYTSGPSSGTKFLYAIAHMPITPRTSDDEITFRCVVPLGG